MKQKSTRTAAALGSGRRKNPKVKPAQTYEYVLLMNLRYNERKQRVVTHVALRTVKEFSNFKYELIVDARLEPGTLRLDIQGLRPPELTLPDVGPAIFETEFDDLRGSVEVVVRKLRKDLNTFRVNVSPKSITIENKPTPRFVDLVTHIEEW